MILTPKPIKLNKIWGKSGRSPCKVVVEVQENERYLPLKGWGDNLNAFDPPAFCWWNRDNMPKAKGVFATLDLAALKSVHDFPVPKGWQWEDAEGWDHSGWEYAVNFRHVGKEPEWGSMTRVSCVRRRKWRRTLVSLPDAAADDSNVYELYIEAEWRSKAHLDFEHAVLKASLTEVYAKLNILLVFEFKRLNTGADARLASLRYATRGLMLASTMNHPPPIQEPCNAPHRSLTDISRRASRSCPNLEKLTMELVKTPTFAFKILTRTGDVMKLPGAEYINKTFVEDLVRDYATGREGWTLEGRGREEVRGGC